MVITYTLYELKSFFTVIRVLAYYWSAKISTSVIRLRKYNYIVCLMKPNFQLELNFY